ncbi:MAG: hypothetical protein AB1640_09795 [bacterium]
MTRKVDYLVISIHEFLKIKPSGEYDRVETRQLLDRLAELIASSDYGGILFDVRELYPTVRLTVLDIYEFVQGLVGRRTGVTNKVAVLTRRDFQFDSAQFFEICAKNRGFQAEAFTDFEAAIDWFSVTRDLGAS